MSIVAQNPTDLQPKTQELNFVVAEDPYEELLAAMDEFECTCTPNNPLACPGCRAYLRAKYGDEIPY